MYKAAPLSRSLLGRSPAPKHGSRSARANSQASFTATLLSAALSGHAGSLRGRARRSRPLQPSLQAATLCRYRVRPTKRHRCKVMDTLPLPPRTSLNDVFALFGLSLLMGAILHLIFGQKWKLAEE